jgi:hypothetical protein
MQVQINTDGHTESIIGRPRDQRRRQAHSLPDEATSPDER